jgi:hypothetical protein
METSAELTAVDLAVSPYRAKSSAASASGWGYPDKQKAGWTGLLERHRGK